MNFKVLYIFQRGLKGVSEVPSRPQEEENMITWHYLQCFNKNRTRQLPTLVYAVETWNPNACGLPVLIVQGRGQHPLPASSQGHQLGIFQAIFGLAWLCFNREAQVCEKSTWERDSKDLFYTA